MEPTDLFEVISIKQGACELQTEYVRWETGITVYVKQSSLFYFKIPVQKLHNASLQDHDMQEMNK